MLDFIQNLIRSQMNLVPASQNLKKLNSDGKS